jgi:hypothetical protein
MKTQRKKKSLDTDSHDGRYLMFPPNIWGAVMTGRWCPREKNKHRKHWLVEWGPRKGRTEIPFPNYPLSQTQDPDYPELKSTGEEAWHRRTRDVNPVKTSTNGSLYLCNTQSFFLYDERKCNDSLDWKPQSPSSEENKKVQR